MFKPFKKTLAVSAAGLLAAAAFAGTIQPSGQASGQPSGQPAGESTGAAKPQKTLADLGAEISAAHIKAMQSGMGRWQESMKPRAPHRLLSRLAGEWDVTSEMFMSQDAPPMTVEFTGTAKMTMGGRFLELRSSGQMMGMPMDSLIIFGYDNVRQLFHMTMYNAMSTGVSTLYGNLDRTGRVLTFVGPMDEPMSGEIGKSFRLVMTLESADRYTYTIDEILYGEPFTVVKSTATRKGR